MVSMAKKALGSLAALRPLEATNALAARMALNLPQNAALVLFMRFRERQRDPRGVWMAIRWTCVGFGILREVRWDSNSQASRESPHRKTAIRSTAKNHHKMSEKQMRKNR